MKITVIEISTDEVLELLGDNIIEVQTCREPTSKEIREWARSQGLQVSKSGTIPKDVVALYYSEVIDRGRA